MLKGLWKGVLPVAIKLLHDQTREKQREFIKEIAILKSLRSTNIVQFQVGHGLSAALACSSACVQHHAWCSSKIFRPDEGWMCRGRASRRGRQCW